MPEVAVYGKSQVATQVTPGPVAQNLPASSFNLGANEIAKFGGELAQVQQRVDTTAAEEAMVNFERAKNTLFFDPDSGYFNTQGRAAFDGAKDTSEALNQLRTDYMKDLSPEASRLFSRSSAAAVTRSSADIMRHSNKQLQAWELSTINASTENALEGGALYWNDPDRLKLNLALGERSVIDKNELEGVSPEVANENLQTYRSSFAKNTVQAAIASSAEDGQQAMDDYGDMLEGPDKATLTLSIEKRTDSQKAKADSATAVLMAGNLVGTYGDQPDARTQINEKIREVSKDNPELGAKLQREATHQLDSKLNADAETNAATMESGLKFQQTGGSVDQFIASNPDAWNDMTTKQQSIVRAGTPVVTNFNEFSKLMLLPPGELSKVNPADHADTLSTTDLNKLQTAVRSARNGTPESQIGRTRAAQITATVDQLFGKKTKRNSEKNKRTDGFYALVDSEVEFREAQKKGKLTSEEFTSLLGDLTRKVVVENARFLFFDAEQDISDIPSTDVRLLTDFLHQNNIPVTADNLIRAFEQAQ